VVESRVGVLRQIGNIVVCHCESQEYRIEQRGIDSGENSKTARS
jgi:hypothetical protein